MRAETNALLGAIVTDLTTSGYPVSVEEDHHPSPYAPQSAASVAMVWFPDGSGNGVLVSAPGEPVSVDEVCAAAHALQDGIVDAGFYATGTATIWPQCPRHPGTHPLTPRTQDGEVVVWACLRTGEVVCRLGELAGVSAGPGDAPD